ncbi:MAG: hypothetical protein CL885_03835 [Dehalococcoidia bacterium]|nr:hypothetical protein [Dehalococcoidia bacterium]|tara:strand:+ start:1807 stop:2739 length:933 start_codon:yes stop_codon:yes gene_type:complete
MNELLRELELYAKKEPTAVAFGVFDGVHLGHKHVFNTLQKAAAKRDLVPIVVTLANHPLSVLRPEVEIHMLTSLDQRLHLIKDAGIEYVAPLTFTKAISQLSAKDFMQTLKNALHMEHFVAGQDVSIGHNRAGDLKVLTELGSQIGYSIETVEQFNLHELPVRSTSIRKALNQGDLTTVTQLLGRHFSLIGPVIQGEGIGKELLGYPTANINVSPSQAIPAEGIYATWIKFNDQLLPSATSIGKKPTFHTDAPLTVETFILDFKRNLYGEHLELEFVERIRGQEKFSTIELLSAEIEKDIVETKRILGVL